MKTLDYANHNENTRLCEPSNSTLSLQHILFAHNSGFLDKVKSIIQCSSCLLAFETVDSQHMSHALPLTGLRHMLLRRLLLLFGRV